MKEKLVTIIVPVYNCESTIIKCIKSLLNQTYNSIEILVVNDGSTDETLKKIQQFDDKRIKVINQENLGVSEARNNGIFASKGDYITFVDADDYVSEKFIESAIKYCNEKKLDLVIGGLQKKFYNKVVDYKLNHNDIKVFEGKELNELQKQIMGYNSDFYPEIRSVFMSGPVCKLFSKEIIRKVGFVKGIKIGEDTLFNLDVLSRSNRIGIVPDIWYYYNINKSSATQKYDENINEEVIKFLFELKDRTKDYLNNSYFNRGIRQLDTIMLLCPFHKSLKYSIISKYRYIVKIRNCFFWSDFFDNLSIKRINTKRYRLFAFMFKYKMYLLIIILYNTIAMKRNLEVQ